MGTALDGIGFIEECFRVGRGTGRGCSGSRSSAGGCRRMGGAPFWFFHEINIAVDGSHYRRFGGPAEETVGFRFAVFIMQGEYSFADSIGTAAAIVFCCTAADAVSGHGGGRA